MTVVSAKTFTKDHGRFFNDRFSETVVTACCRQNACKIHLAKCKLQIHFESSG